MVALHPSAGSAEAQEALPDIPPLVIDFTTPTDITADGYSHFEIQAPRGVYKDAEGRTLNTTKGVKYNCFGRQDNPHYSSGAKGVISKAFLKCSGPAGVIPILVNQELAKSPSKDLSKLRSMAKSSYTQNVTVNAKGWSQPWYVPSVSKPGVPKGTAGYWRAAHYGQSVPPMVTFLTTPGMSQLTYIG